MSKKGFWSLLIVVVAVGLGTGSGLAMITRAPVSAPQAAVSAATGPAGSLAAGVTGAPAEGAGRRSTTGTVDQIEGQKLVVKTDSGAVEVALNDQTTYRIMNKVSPQDLKAGEAVVARGEAGADGTITAQSLQVMPAGAGPGTIIMGGGPGQASPDSGGTAGRRGAGGATSTGGAAAGRPAGVNSDGAGNTGGGGVAFGTIQSVDGKAVTLTTASGPVKLTIADSADIRRSDAGSREDLKPGQAIAVVGQSVANAKPGGPMTAVSITITGD